jgi:UDP:flavonoid glycosyltransferase YjiC (YdhE family)
MNILVISFGGGGDIHPMVALGRALLERGHQVCFVSYPKFEPLARKLGLEFAGYGAAHSLKPAPATGAWSTRWPALPGSHEVLTDGTPGSA